MSALEVNSGISSKSTSGFSIASTDKSKIPTSISNHFSSLESCKSGWFSSSKPKP